MELLVVRWSEIPEKDWLKVLATISVGDCVRDLPYFLKADAPGLSIPIETCPYFAMEGNEGNSEVTIPTMEFAQFKLQAGELVWRRTR